MITCMGLIAGIVTIPSAQDVLNQCAKFLKKYKHLLECGTEFAIDGTTYATVIDYCTEDGETFILYRMYDGRTKIGTSK